MRHLLLACVLLLASALLCSCATAHGDAWAPDGLSVDLDAPSLVCDETRLEGATTFTPSCRPTDETSAFPVTGLEALSPSLHTCVLTSLPVETGPVDPLPCQQGAAQVLQGRLRQLGWLDATVAPQAGLDVQLGERYRIGGLQVEHDPDARVAPHRILSKARDALPEEAWFTPSTLAAMQARVFQMKKFRAVWVIGGEPDPEQRIVPVVIDVWEKPGKKPRKPKLRQESRRKRPDHCPKRGSICLNGRDCAFDQRLGCTVCNCRPSRL